MLTSHLEQCVFNEMLSEHSPLYVASLCDLLGDEAGEGILSGGEEVGGNAGKSKPKLKSGTKPEKRKQGTGEATDKTKKRKTASKAVPKDELLKNIATLRAESRKSGAGKGTTDEDDSSDEDI